MTKEQAIRRLKRLAKEWPDSLWIFANGGRLSVMEKCAGEKAITETDGFDPVFEIARIDIEADGGDW